MADNYFALLKRPEWQKKRLQILERDGWSCCFCHDTDKTLHVHHGFYAKNLAPWEYPNWSLSTLCEKCHEEITEKTRYLKEIVATMGPNYIDQIIGFVEGLRAIATIHDEIDFNNGSEFRTMNSMRTIMGFAKAITMPTSKTIEAAKGVAIKQGTTLKFDS